MAILKTLFAAAVALSLVSAHAELIPRGTPVTLVFDQDLNSKTAKAGDTVMMHVLKDVVVDGKVIIPAGAREEALIASVSGRGKFGKNASIRLALNAVIGKRDKQFPLQPRSEGHSFKGSRTDHAALVAGAGLVVLGPVGLVGGLFVPGKEVKIKTGDKLESEISHDVRL
ncbi:MAG TPA: hypothetical protein VKT78_12905 [Fimbriimonadaceae bacterium]|nr:hypothetical protein [Fimbriimonadaceae bacterium]